MYFNAQEYDYVIPTEIEEEFGKVRKLKLPYNKTSESLLVRVCLLVALVISPLYSWTHSSISHLTNPNWNQG